MFGSGQTCLRNSGSGQNRPQNLQSWSTCPIVHLCHPSGTRGIAGWARLERACSEHPVGWPRLTNVQTGWCLMLWPRGQGGNKLRSTVGCPNGPLSPCTPVKWDLVDEVGDLCGKSPHYSITVGVTSSSGSSLMSNSGWSFFVTHNLPISSRRVPQAR